MKRRVALATTAMLAACAPAPTHDDVKTAEPGGDASLVGTFTLHIDPAAGSVEVLDTDSTTAGVSPIRNVQDGVAGSGPNGSVELVTANTGNGMAGCGVPDTFCGDVTVRTFYQETTLTDLEVQLIRITPATGHEATNSEVSLHGLDTTLGLWSYGTLDPVGGGTTELTETWQFGDDGQPFTVVGLVWANPAVCSSPAVAIPDNDAMGVADTITLTELGTIQDVNVELDVTHTWVGDLVVNLEHAGTDIDIVDRPGRVSSGFGCSGDNADVTLDDEGPSLVEDQCDNLPALSGNRRPNNALSAFDGMSMTGAWNLTVSDRAGADTGTFDQWCLQIRAN